VLDCGSFLAGDDDDDGDDDDMMLVMVRTGERLVGMGDRCVTEVKARRRTNCRLFASWANEGALVGALGSFCVMRRSNAWRTLCTFASSFLTPSDDDEVYFAC
jgi:hypothetical protein